MLAGTRYAAGAGYATLLPAIDFETYSEAGLVYDPHAQRWESLPGLSKQKRGLKGCGLYNYVRHPTFEVLSLSYDLMDGLGVRFWRPGLPMPQDLLDYVSCGGLLSAWNVGFELEVWNTYCVSVLGWPPLDPNNVRCDAAKSRAQSYPGALKDAGPAVGLPHHLLKDDAGDALIRKLTMPKNPTKKNTALRWTRATAIEEFAKFDAYNVQDVVTEHAMQIRIKDLSPRELAIWQFDQRCNRRGMQIDVAGRDNCISIVEQCMQKHNAELRYITNEKVSSYTKVADMLAWMRSQGSYLYNLDEETIEEQIKQAHAPAVLRAMKIRQLLSFGSVKKLYAMRAQTCADGRLRDQYIYHGAHTALWNGQNVQPANLYKGKLHTVDEVERALAVIGSCSLDYVEGVYGDALEVVADCLRSMIIAGPGCDLIAADYSAIQAVVTSAIAGEEWRLEVFRARGDIYLAMASRLTGTPIEVYLKYRKDTGAHHPDRQLGKLAVLSADFGAWIAGWKRFGAEKYGDDQWLKQTILRTRETQPMVTELWGGQVRNKFQADERPELYGLEGAAIKAILEPEKCFGYRGVRYMVYGRDLYCQPPTDGDPIVYHEIELEPSKRDYARPYELQMNYTGWNSNQTKGAGGWARMKLYGGVQTQNVVAKTSREYQANALLALEATGLYLPVMHTHDEQVTEVPKGQGSTEEYLNIVNRVPSWAHTPDGKPWPVRAPGAERTARYGKWE